MSSRTGSTPRARSQSRYAALLVSLHGTTLYAMRDLDREPPETAAAIREEEPER